MTEYLREIVNSNILAPIFNLPASLHNRDVEVIILPADSEQNHTNRSSARGRMNKYANPDLIPLENDAWVKAAEGKHQG